MSNIISKRHRSAVTAMQRQTGVQLNVVEEQFVFEYCKDYDHRRAAEAIGLHPDKGTEMISHPNVAEAIRIVYNAQMTASELTPEIIKEEMYNLYQLALQKKQYGVASKQLDQLARHSHIDAYAAQRVSVAADAEVARALAAGRKRVAQSRGEIVEPTDQAKKDFM